MRKITSKAVEAFLSGEDYNGGNTTVEARLGGLVYMFLFRNLIARRDENTGKISISLAGWNTNTTRERLNGLPNVRVSTRQGQAFLNGNKWNGEWITV